MDRSQFKFSTEAERLAARDAAAVADAAAPDAAVSLDADAVDVAAGADADTLDGMATADTKQPDAQAKCVNDVACADDNPCTDDKCDPATGCTHAPSSKPCSDDNVCTIGDHCVNVTCLPGTATPCNDGNACTADSCNKAVGCVHVSNDATCTDDNACTVGDKCAGVACKPGPLSTCADANPCTDDSCNAQAGCKNSANTKPCDDGDTCTVADACSGAKCTGGSSAACDDGEACTDDACTKGSGCVHLAAVATCTDGNSCTIGEACVAGKCGGGQPTMCDDKQPCTADSCNKLTGCVHLATAATCTDGNLCTIGDSCTGGVCLPGAATSCTDGNACTADSCAPSVGCANLPVATTCTDGKPCTKDACVGGKCVSDDGKCNDGTACTLDICKAAGCAYLPNDLADCESDGNPCTQDVCAGANCGHVAKPGPCDDGSACTVGDACSAGVCKPGAAKNCDDGNACTLDEDCDAKAGCVHINLDGKKCDDKNACTDGDACIVGTCAGKSISCDDSKPCTTDNCNSDKGCLHDATKPGVACGPDMACDGWQYCVPAELPTGMTAIPSGTFWMGCNPAKFAECDADELPQHRVSLRPYAIHTTEVTTSAYKKCVDAGACLAPTSTNKYSNWDNPNKQPKPGRELHPMNAVPRELALAYCKWLGKATDPAHAPLYDLPTEAQWEMAARGSCAINGAPNDDIACKAAMRTYPWGEATPTCDLGIIAEKDLGCGLQSTSPVGSKPKGASPYGLHDMAGNVVEWLRDYYLEDAFCYSPVVDPPGPVTSTFRQLRGGSWARPPIYQRLGLRYFGPDTAALVSTEYGIRCVRNSPPLPCASTATCDDGNACTDDSCSGIDGCKHVVLPNGSTCTDGNACTGPDKCQCGTCAATGPTNCDDGNSCTADSCDKAKGCVHVAGPANATCGPSSFCDAAGTCVGPPVGMTYVPGASFWMGCNEVLDASCAGASGPAAEKPQHKVALSPYYMDTTEVTGDAFKACVAAGACVAPFGDTFSANCNWDSEAKQPKAGRGTHPVNCVNWTEAQKFCKWRGSQAEPQQAAAYNLPTEAQWEMAARGDCVKNGVASTDDAKCKAAMRSFPWGEKSPACSLATFDSGTGKGCGSGTTAAVGSIPAGASPFGMMDLVGNVAEWTRDWYGAAYYESSPTTDPTGPTSGSAVVTRGGSFTGNAAAMRAGARGTADPALVNFNIGFRCVRAAK